MAQNNNKMASTVILVTQDGMGRAEAELSRKLAGIYFKMLIENGDLPSAICFYADGVKLTAKDSTVTEQLAALEIAGVRLIVCTTCLNYFGLIDHLAVGIAGGMGDILAAQMAADKVITI